MLIGMEVTVAPGEVMVTVGAENTLKLLLGCVFR